MSKEEIKNTSGIAANETILGRKSKAQILRDRENRFIQFVVGNLLWITGIILFIIFSAQQVSDKISWLILAGIVILGTILIYLGVRCPFCDSVKGYDRWESKYFFVRKWTLKCDTCNLTDKKISEIIDLLKRNVEITPDTIAKFNRREL